MRGRTLLISGLLVATAASVPGVAGGAATTQALPCPVAQLSPACGAVDLVVATACSDPTPDIPTIGPVTIKIEGGAPVQCPQI